jgi:hypothetical protein
MIVAADGKIVGYLLSPFEGKSFLNAQGEYGSKFSSVSIWNEFGIYGSEYSQFSPFNKFSDTPPQIQKDGRALMYLTVNQTKSPRISPRALAEMFEQ